jgi:hypothetical protein
MIFFTKSSFAEITENWRFKGKGEWPREVDGAAIKIFPRGRVIDFVLLISYWEKNVSSLIPISKLLGCKSRDELADSLATKEL